MEEAEVPEFFICPITLQIMKDPVIAITGITYDRPSIEKWLSQRTDTICPVSKQPLPRNSTLTPNHILSKLIQTWHVSSNPFHHQKIPHPNADVVTKPYIVSLLANLTNPKLQLQTLAKLEAVAAAVDKESCIYGQLLVEAGVYIEMLNFVISCHKNGHATGLEQALHILYLIYNSSDDTRKIVFVENDENIDSLIWALNCESYDHTNNKSMKTYAMVLLKILVENTNSNVQERLKQDFFKTIVHVLSKHIMSQNGTKAALHLMLGACPWGKNRLMMVEVGAVFTIIELELSGSMLERRTSELSLQVLFHLCCCADGRAQLLSHAAGIAVVTKRIMKVSAATDDAAVSIISSISKFSGTDWVVHEMLRVGTVSRLCLVLQSNSHSGLKEKAREILRKHTNVWKNSPCADILLLTR